MAKWSLLPLCASLMLASTVQAAEGEDLCQQFLDAMHRRSTAFTSADYRAFGTTTASAESLADDFGVVDVRKKLLPQQGRTWPSTTHWIFDFSRNRMRQEVLRQHVAFDIKNKTCSFYPKREWWLFDGRDLQSYEPRFENTSAEFTPGPYQTELFLCTSDFFSSFLRTEDDVFFLAHGRFPQRAGIRFTRLERPPVMSDLIWVGRESVAGAECHMFHTPRSLRETWYEFVVDLNRDGAVLWQVRRLGQQTLDRLDITYAEQDGHWLPSGYVYQQFNDDGQVQKQTRALVRKIELNQKLDPGQFQVQPTPGMIIYDAVNQKDYRVEPDGTLRSLAEIRSAAKQPVPVIEVQVGVDSMEVD